MKKTVKIQYMKSSNNYYVYIPRKMIKEMDLKPGEEVEITVTKKNVPD